MDKSCTALNVDGSSCLQRVEKTTGPLALCEAHRASVWNYYREVFRDRLIAKMEEKGCIKKHTFGITYFIQLPNGNIKIGYVHTPENLASRMQELFNEHGGRVKLLATAYGGESMEALMHFKFKHLKVRGSWGEQFSPTNELVEYTQELGHVPGGIQAMTILRKRIEGFHAKS